MSKLVFTVVQFGLQSSIPFEPSRATKSGSRGGVFEAPDSPEEATMARQPFQEHLKGRSVQELL